MMRAFFLAIGIFMSSLAFSQVGVETTAPTESLDVDGTARLRNLPTKGQTNAIYTKPDGTKAATQSETFTPTHTVVVDANGVLGTVAGLPPVPVGSTASNTEQIKVPESVYNTSVFDSSIYGDSSNAAAEAERDRVQDELTYTLGCLTVWFRPILTTLNRYGGYVYAKLNNTSTDGEPCVAEDTGVRFAGINYHTGTSDSARMNVISQKEVLTPGMTTPAELGLFNYNSEEAVFIDVMLVKNRQHFRISGAGTSGAATGGTSYVVFGLERKY